MPFVLKSVMAVVGSLVALAGAGWLGLQIRPAAFATLATDAAAQETVPLPDDLPPPVARFYREIYGKQVPVIRSAVISGRAILRINGITFPARFRFTHDAGQGYRHYIEATLACP